MAALASFLSGSTADSEPESRLLSRVRQLTFEGRRAGEGYFSRDGRQMVFQSEREPGNPFFQIYLLDLETGDTTRVSPGHGKTTCSWIHPNGGRVLFASTHDDPRALEKQREELELRASGQQRRYSWDYDEHFELYMANLGDGSTSRLTDATGYDAEGSISPDGSTIVFASNRHAYTAELSASDREKFEIDKSFLVDLYGMRSDGTGLRRLTDVKGYDGGPFFSHDGSRIGWRRFSEDGVTAEIYVMNADGTEQRQITRMGTMSWAPFFHPTGQYLIFATNKHGFGNFELYLVDSAGRADPVRVTFTDGFDGLPVFAPDGSSLSWTSNRSANGSSQLFVSNWNHEKALELLQLAGGTVSSEEHPGTTLPSTSPDIRAVDIRSHVDQLSSEAFDGRLTGTPGEKLATEYVAAYFRELGLEPAGDDGTYFQSFEFTAGVSLGNTNVLTSSVAGSEVSPVVDRDWRPLAFSKLGSVGSSEVVFAGYGIVAPEAGDQAEYDSYVHLDVDEKWVMTLRYMPEDIPAPRRQHLGRYSGLRYKAMVARDRGARGVMFVSGPNSKVRDDLIKLSFDVSLSGTSLAAVSISDEFAWSLLETTEKSLEDLQHELDSGEPSMGFPLSDVRIGAHIELKQEKARGRNVVALLPATGGKVSESIALGAHLDHLGRGGTSSSRATKEESGQIHFGADDNASGTAALLEIAEYLVDQSRQGKLNLKRNVIFAAWSGEELGLLGSNHYANSFSGEGTPLDLKPALAAYLNMDMIGRLREKLVLQGVGSSSVWPGIIERRNAPVGLAIATQNDSYLPTDATSFYLKKVPILSAFTGSHEEYHSPRDRPETLNYEGSQQVARFMSLVARDLATREDPPDYIAMEKPAEMSERSGLRVYLGTIPDYAQGEVAGLKLSGVAKGGPADEAGMKGGDIIVELAGRKIENIYDYTYAIDSLKIGEPIKVVVVREGRRVALELTPGSRE